MNEYFSKQVNVGALSPNEFRKEMGLPKVEGLDYYTVQVNTYQVIDGKITLPTMEQEDNKEDKVEEEQIDINEE